MPFFSAISLISSLVTMVFTVYSFPFIKPSCRRRKMIYQVKMILVWLPFSKTHSPLSSLTATPRRSPSGSQAIARSASISRALSNAILNAAGSSGLAEATVGKSPSVTICSGIVVMLVNPQFFRESGTSL